MEVKERRTEERRFFLLRVRENVYVYARVCVCVYICARVYVFVCVCSARSCSALHPQENEKQASLLSSTFSSTFSSSLLPPPSFSPSPPPLAAATHVLLQKAPRRAHVAQAVHKDDGIGHASLFSGASRGRGCCARLQLGRARERCGRERRRGGGEGQQQTRPQQMQHETTVSRQVPV